VDVPKTRYAVTPDDVYLAYQTFGEGPHDLLVIHPWVSHIEIYWEWSGFGRLMGSLAAGARVTHFDKRGMGLSDPIVRTPSLETRMDDARVVMDAAGIDRGTVFGWGQGASLACLLAASYPERVSALILYAPQPRWRWAPDWPTGLTDDELERSRELMFSGWGDEEHAETWLEEAAGASEMHRKDPELQRFAARFARYGCSPGAARTYERIFEDTDIRAVLPTVRVPTLVLYRGKDQDDEEWATFTAHTIPAAQLRQIEGEDWVPWLGPSEQFGSEVHRFVASIEAEAELDRQLATVLFTDIVRSTEMAAEVGDRAWRDLVQRHHATIRVLLDRYRGTEVDTAGDGFFATFDGPARAVRCALAIAEAVASHGIEIRAGVHTGEVETIDKKVGGIAVNIGARVGVMAGPSEVLVSQTVKDLVAGSGLTFEPRGEHELKGVPGEWRLYAATAGSEA
jgi:class 3 adenylate cyclase